jgi:cation transport regulator ChaC
MEREAIWLAYDRKCAYTREPVGFADFHIDHIVPESLSIDVERLERVKAELRLPSEFNVLGYENLVPCKPGANLQKTDIIFDPAPIQFFLGMASAKKEAIETNLHKINSRNNRGKAVMLLQQSLKRGEIKPVEVEGILEHHQDHPEEIFDLIESLELAENEDLKAIRKGDIGELKMRPVNLSPNTHVEGLTLHNGHGDILVRTCAEYNAALRAGFYPRTTFDMSMATFFVRQCGLLNALDGAMIADRSFLSEPLVGITDLQLIPFAFFPVLERPPEPPPLETYQDMLDKGNLVVKRVKQNSLAVESGGMGQHLIEVARADFNGDGVEEILVYEYCYAIGGTLRWASMRLLSRHSHNDPFEIVQEPENLARHMWVFGYGSLMWDGWEKEFGCLRRCVATLEGYGRIFNKASTRNRGTKRNPCPTLNLEKVEGGACKGMAFEFPADREGDIREYLERREGRDFRLQGLIIRLEDHVDVVAYVQVYGGKNLVSASTVDEKAALVRDAVGEMGSCADYLNEIARMLADLGIDDPVVSELWLALKEDGGGKVHPPK